MEVKGHLDERYEAEEGVRINNGNGLKTELKGVLVFSKQISP